MFSQKFHNWTNRIGSIPQYFIDVGVGIPNSEAWIASQCWPDTTIIGIEPGADRYNACAPTFPGTLLEYCIGREDGVFAMTRVIGHSDISEMPHMFTLPEYVGIHDETIDIPMRSLDSLSKELGPFNDCFIWADIEGAEMEMLLGCTELIEENMIRGLNLELWNEKLGDGWTTYSEVNEFLMDHGFTMTGKWQIRPDRGGFADYIYEKPVSL